MSWNNFRQSWQKMISNPDFKKFIGSPITKIVGINTAMFLLWRIKGVSETFLVKHFSFDRFNIRQHRYHTMITYAFSHFGFFMFNMIILSSFGRFLRINYGNKIVWTLYLLGAFFGGLSMSVGMPNLPMVVPQVGADAAISAMLTFYGLLNPYQSVMFFFFPVNMWVLLGIMGVYSLIEPSKKNLGGMVAGVLVYSLFRFRIM